MARRTKRPVRHRKTVPVESIMQLLEEIPEDFSLSTCAMVEHLFYKFGYSILHVTDTDGRVRMLPMPASNFVMFTRDPCS